VDYIQKCVRHSTGIAFIFVAENGENCIAVAPGANNLLRGERMDTILPVIKEADALVLQLEIPYESVISLIEYAHTVDTKIILNPAPAKQIPSYILEKVDILILNETEAMLIAGQSLDFSEPIGIARSLLRRVGQVVILTLGEKGSVIVSDEMEKQIPSYVVNTVDTTGAGDTFCGAFVAQWVEGVDLQDCVQFATAAAALSVTRIGAQVSIPYQKEVIEFMRNRIL
jgi:ribokinase